MGANYSFYVKNIETHARAFFKVIIFSIGSVSPHNAGYESRLVQSHGSRIEETLGTR